jgi:hypothetical protein
MTAAELRGRRQQVRPRVTGRHGTASLTIPELLHQPEEAYEIIEKFWLKNPTQISASEKNNILFFCISLFFFLFSQEW